MKEYQLKKSDYISPAIKTLGILSEGFFAASAGEITEPRNWNDGMTQDEFVNHGIW